MITTPFERSSSYLFGAGSPRSWHDFKGVKSLVEIPLFYIINGLLFGNQRYAVYMEMTEEDLNSCQQRGDQYYCPILGKFKRTRRSCLMSLYGNDPEEVQQDYPLTVGRPEARVERIDTSNWLLIEPEPSELRIQCTNGYNYRTDVHGNYIINVKEGCDINTKNINVHQPMYEGDMVVQGVLEVPLLPPNVWIDEGSETHFQNITQQLLQRVGQKAPLNEIKTLATFRRQFEEARATSWKFTWPKWMFHSLLPSLTSVVMVITGLLLLQYLLPVVLQKFLTQKRKEKESARLNQKGRVEVRCDPDTFDPEDALYNTL